MIPVLPLRAVFLVLGAAVLGAPSWAQSTVRVNLRPDGLETGLSAGTPKISADGRFVAFVSQAPGLVDVDTNGTIADVFVRDLQTGTNEIVSVSSAGTQGNGPSVSAAISADGRFVAFSSLAILAPNDEYPFFDMYVRDRLLGTTERVSLSASNEDANGDCTLPPAISADGRFVVFESSATNLGSSDPNVSNVLLRDRLAGTTELVSSPAAGVSGGSGSTISADGRYVAFTFGHVYVRDRQLHTYELVDRNHLGFVGNAASFSPSISADGRFVAFWSLATNLVPTDSNGARDVFVCDRLAGTTVRASVSSTGAQSDGDSETPTLSADGRHVAFWSLATNLVDGDANGVRDVYVHHLATGATERASVSSGGTEGNDLSDSPTLSADGRYVAFQSLASNLVPADRNLRYDVFVRDREAGTSFMSLCDPGADGVVACPCANPSSGAQRGCDNSAGTGGAALVAFGACHLSADTLVFTTNGEKPTATSIVLQGTSPLASGVVYGQGVRCVGGALKRLYTKIAWAGAIQAPASGDPSVSTRSAELGSPIAAGESRWYLVYYRDPIVLGGCDTALTFNATQTGVVGWSP